MIHKSKLLFIYERIMFPLFTSRLMVHIPVWSFSWLVLFYFKLQVVYQYLDYLRGVIIRCVLLDITMRVYIYFKIYSQSGLRIYKRQKYLFLFWLPNCEFHWNHDYCYKRIYVSFILLVEKKFLYLIIFYVYQLLLARYSV